MSFNTMTFTLTLLFIIGSSLCLSSSAMPSAKPTVENKMCVLEPGNPKSYMECFYHKISSGNMFPDMPQSLRVFQAMANINVTGKINNETLEMMKKPRCGVKDYASSQNRFRRYDVMSRLPEADSEITWRVNSFTNDLTQDEIIDTMRSALEVWATHTGINFTQVTDTTDDNVDINIEFKTRDHEDGNMFPAFDGIGHVIAHAFFPNGLTEEPSLAGDVHFDDDELFTLNTSIGINLFQIAVHEFGHSLGLGHSANMGAVMSPFYQDYIPNYQLHSDDIRGIKYLYEPSQDVEKLAARPNVKSQECPDSIDETVAFHDGRIFFLQGNLVWQIVLNDGVVDGFPKQISEVFSGLPNDIDAGLVYEQRLYFFKGSMCYEYTDNLTFNGSYPIRSRWRGLPNDIDAAFVLNSNGGLYFVIGSKYYRFNINRGRVYAGYPRATSTWNIDLIQIDAALGLDNGPNYFFSGPQYYRLNDSSVTLGTDNGYPRLTKPWWLGCGHETGKQIGRGNMVAPSLVLLTLSALRNLCFL